MGYTQEVGNRAEDAAADYLTSCGFSICHRNWRSGRYELDIIAKKEGILHFIEVKCRKDGGLTQPEEAMTLSKFDSLTKAAQAYIEFYDIDLEVQFDLVCVLHNNECMDIRYYPDVMYCHW